VVADDAIPVAHELCEVGWLRREFVGDELVVLDADG
jgi:hypothetical protein